MQITIFGASGKVGRLTVAEALKRGHTVVAVVHGAQSSKVFDTPNLLDPATKNMLRIRRGDVHDTQSITDAIAGSHAIISTLGSWGTSSKDILTSAMSAIIPAMTQQGIARIVTLTGTEAYDETDSPNMLRRAAHFAAALGAGKILSDGEKHIALLRKSNLEWTTLRSPVMFNRTTTAYRLTLQPMPPWQSIARTSVAKALVDQIDGPGYLREAPFVYQR